MRKPDRRQLPVERARQQERYHAEDERSQAFRAADLKRRQRAMQNRERAGCQLHGCVSARTDALHRHVPQ